MTSRRTSIPHWGKENDPTNKGKRKEKRPDEAKTESESNPELEEAPRKEKENEKRREELHRKRGEDALRFHRLFGKAGKSKKSLYLDCILDSNILTPSKNDNEVPLARAILIACIMVGIHINVGDIIATGIRDRAWQGHTSLPFLVLITNICQDAGVPEIERIDEYIWANQVLDITKIQDGMNPKFKKRKREPVVAHVYETELGIDSQVEHTQAAEA
ncbi:hypothetical protein HAX54_021861 [Datura stramonium]|uniref:Putative plant transposon protein domain-containing protein n=1 Tax=Datura stramonium TaxID=4076 RepID=A0ABS8UUX1_DATST|nr:hypothetical protein [Datura stramonium]